MWFHIWILLHNTNAEPMLSSVKKKNINIYMESLVMNEDGIAVMSQLIKVMKKQVHWFQSLSLLRLWKNFQHEISK